MKPTDDQREANSPALPIVRGESLYDRVSSFLMALVIGAFLVVGWLWLVYQTNEAYASRVTAPLEIIEVYGGGGGSPDGTEGSTEKVDVPGAEAAEQASNNEEVPGAFEEPSVQQNPAVMLEAVASEGQSLASVDVGAVMPSGGLKASGKRASKLGTGGPGLGFGPGDGGVPSHLRWSIVYNTDQSPEEYARQLDAFDVELAVVTGKDQLTYVSHFSSDTPTKRVGSGSGDKRLFFLWQGQGRKAHDLTLMRKAGIEVGDKNLFQFYPKRVEQELAQVEYRYRKKSPLEIKATRFSVVPQDEGYGFVVLAQSMLR